MCSPADDRLKATACHQKKYKALGSLRSQPMVYLLWALFRECIKELHLETSPVHGQCWPPEWTRASRAPLHEVGEDPTAVPPHKPSLLSSGPWGTESAKLLREDPLTEQMGSKRQHSRHGNRSKQCQSPSPLPPGRPQFPSPSPPQSHPTDEQLTHSLGDLHLHPWPWES